MKLEIGKFYLLKVTNQKHINDIWEVVGVSKILPFYHIAYVLNHYGFINEDGSIERCLSDLCDNVICPAGSVESVYPLFPITKQVSFAFDQTSIDSYDGNGPVIVYNAPGWITNSEWFDGEVYI